MVGVAQLGDVLGQGAEEAELAAEVGDGSAVVPSLHDREVTDGDEGAQMVAEAGRGAGCELLGIGGEGLELFKSFLAGAPFLIAAGAPFREVLGADRAAGEVLGKDLADVGEVVEPGEDLGGGLSVGEAAVELVAERLGEAGDFAGAHRF